MTNVSLGPLRLIFSLQVAFVQDNFHLKNPIDRFRFFFELHNLPSALPFDPELSGDSASGRRDKLKQQVYGANLTGFTGTGTGTGSKRKRTESQSNNPPGKRSQTFGDRGTVRRLSDAGYQVLQEVEVPGWTLLNPVRFSWFYFVTQH